MTKIYFGMATHPKREPCLPSVITSILPQCTKLFVYLNDYKDVPLCLKHPKIIPLRSQEYGECGDIGKFHMVDKLNGYYFTVDDDIVYPPDYAQNMVNLIKQHSNKIVAGVHGCVLNFKNFWNYYRSRNLTHYRAALPNPRFVHVIGTGTAAFHTQFFCLNREMFAIPNMADIWFAIEGQKQKVPFLLIKRKSGWLQDAPHASQTSSIYTQSLNKKHGTLQTNVIQEYKNWNLYHD
jgi:hypothetical protein